MTDQPKWTPGPWVAHKMQNIFQVHRHGVRPGYAERIADVIYWTKGHTGPSGNPLIEDAEANAHLIAAAPGMATVLEYYADQFCEGFCKDLPQAGTYQPEMDLDCSGCKARAALAKARGQA